MIITLCESIYTAIENNDDNTIDFLDDILTARRNGFISLLLSKKNILQLLSTLDLNSRQKSILNFDKENSTYLNQKLRDFDSSVNFYHSQYKKDSSGIDISNYKENVSNSEWHPLSKPYVIFENKDDDLVYRKILNWYLSKHVSNKDLHLSYEVIHGGGHTTASVSAQALDSRLGVYAVCDSDKKSPYSDIGDTAKAAKAMFDLKNYSSNFLCIEAHEVENLVPLKFHEETALETQLPAIDFIKYALTKCNVSYLYYDFKESLKVELINSETQCGSYWKQIIVDSAYGEGLESRKANDKIVCKLSTLVKHSIKKFDESTNIEIDSSSLADEWTKIGSFLVPRVIASRPYKM
ncbi:hypothetical protein AB6C73_15135 [Vibrio splendidus]